jgi:hypothetical protein
MGHLSALIPPPPLPLPLPLPRSVTRDLAGRLSPRPLSVPAFRVTCRATSLRRKSSGCASCEGTLSRAPPAPVQLVGAQGASAGILCRQRGEAWAGCPARDGIHGCVDASGGCGWVDGRRGWRAVGLARLAGPGVSVGDGLGVDAWETQVGFCQPVQQVLLAAHLGHLLLVEQLLVQLRARLQRRGDYLSPTIRLGSLGRQSDSIPQARDHKYGPMDTGTGIFVTYGRMKEVSESESCYILQNDTNQHVMYLWSRCRAIV